MTTDLFVSAQMSMDIAHAVSVISELIPRVNIHHHRRPNQNAVFKLYHEAVSKGVLMIFS